MSIFFTYVVCTVVSIRDYGMCKSSNSSKRLFAMTWLKDVVVVVSMEPPIWCP